jgi:hypothetical protein
MNGQVSVLYKYLNLYILHEEDFIVGKLFLVVDQTNSDLVFVMSEVTKITVLAVFDIVRVMCAKFFLESKKLLYKYIFQKISNQIIKQFYF